MRTPIAPSRLPRALALVVPLLAAAGGAAGQTASFRLEPSTNAVAPGAPVTIEVHLDDPSLAPIGGVQLALLFDSDIYELTGFEGPDDLAGAVDPNFFAWNGPAPIGVGGTFGCSSWWDGLGVDGISALATFPGAGFAASSGLLFRFELTALPTAPLGAATIAHAPPDSTCLWSGTVIVDPDGDFLPTGAPDLALPITNVPPVTDLACGSAGGDAMLGWSLGASYGAIRIRRDGALLPPLAGNATSYVDTSVVPGATHEYSVVGVAVGLESPAATCSITVTNGVSPPVALACSDLGGAALLEWLNPPVGWQTLQVLRGGAVLATLPGTATSFTDPGPPIGAPVSYAVRGVLDAVIGQSAQCTVTVTAPSTTFRRGDSNGDAMVNIADASTTLTHLFQSGSIPCQDAADANDSGGLDIADAVYVLSFLFSSGPQPPPPYPGAGTDPTADALGCGGS